jgi:hypothetical protein
VLSIVVEEDKEGGGSDHKIDMRTVGHQCYTAVTQAININSDNDEAQRGLRRGPTDRSAHLKRPSTTGGTLGELAQLAKKQIMDPAEATTSLGDFLEKAVGTVLDGCTFA